MNSWKFFIYIELILFSMLSLFCISFFFILIYTSNFDFIIIGIMILLIILLILLIYSIIERIKKLEELKKNRGNR